MYCVKERLDQNSVVQIGVCHDHTLQHCSILHQEGTWQHVKAYCVRVSSRLNAELLKGLAAALCQIAQVLEVEQLCACEGLRQPLRLRCISQEAELLLNRRLLPASSHWLSEDFSRFCSRFFHALVAKV